MRILLIVVYYLPSTMSSAKLIHDLAMEFLRLGHEPVVVAPDENIPTDVQITMEDGIKVLRVRTGKIKKASRVVRAINEARLSHVIWEKGHSFFAENPADLIVYYSPTIFFGSLVKRLKKQFHCPSYLVLRDIFPQWAVDTGVLHRGLIYRFFKYIERQNYDAADVIGVQSPANMLYFEDTNCLERYRLEVLYNWTTLEEENIVPGTYREQLGLVNKVVFFYGGNIGVAQDMDNIIRLARNLRDEETAFFLLVGEGSEVPRLRNTLASEGLTNIAIHDPVGQKEYLSMLSEFDIGVISLDRALKTQNFPGKMLGYMYYSMPILASVNSGNDLMTMLQEHSAGLVCCNGDDEALAAHARILLKDEIMRREFGENARSLLENVFSVSKAAKQILGHFTNGN